MTAVNAASCELRPLEIPGGHPQGPPQRQRQLGCARQCPSTWGSTPQSAVREPFEEAGIAGLFGHPLRSRHVILSASNGEVCLEFPLTPNRPVHLRRDDHERESREVRWVSHDQVTALW